MGNSNIGVKEEVFLKALLEKLPLIGIGITKNALWPRVEPGHASTVELAILLYQETQMRVLTGIEERLAQERRSFPGIFSS